MTIKIELPKINTKMTNIKAEGTIAKNGVISASEFADFSASLQQLSKSTCSNLPEQHIAWEEGVTKHHIKLDGTEYKADTKEGAFLASYMGIVRTLPVADKLSEILPKYEQNPDAHTISELQSEIESTIGIIDCAVGKAHQVVDEL